jgi:acetylornithine deacetylase/succinyl-diaminopimelate desuccinylase-like protein
METGAVLDDAQRICAIPAPTFAEAERAAFVAERFRALGLATRIDEVGNVICRLGGDGPAAAVLAAHLDTVFPATHAIEIEHDAHAGRIAAAGIGDNALGVAALLHLARRLADVPLGKPLVLAATIGEEGLGDLRGAKHLVATVPCAAFVAVEGAMLDAIKTAGVGSVRSRVTYRGPGGHSWGDRGMPSAIHGLLERAQAFLHATAGADVGRNVGRIEGGTSINTIAAEATLELDLRAEDGAALAEVARLARETFAAAPEGLAATVEPLGGGIASDHPLVEAARRAREQAGLPPASEGSSSTDANAAYGQGIPAITVGITTGGGAHRADEYIDVEPIERGLHALELLARELGEAPGAASAA